MNCDQRRLLASLTPISARLPLVSGQRPSGSTAELRKHLARSLSIAHTARLNALLASLEVVQADPARARKLAKLSFACRWHGHEKTARQVVD
jgi:hypothetical protein